MTGNEFVTLVNYYGESNILGIGFDNSSAITFGPNEFKLDNCYIADIQALQYVAFDSKGLPFHIIKTLDGVQTIMVRDSMVPLNAYDRITVRP